MYIIGNKVVTCRQRQTSHLPRGRHEQTTDEQTTGTTFHKMFKNVNILEFHDYIWNHYEKCNQKSTNMPGIGSFIREIHVRISDFEKANY